MPLAYAVGKDTPVMRFDTSNPTLTFNRAVSIPYSIALVFIASGCTNTLMMDTAIALKPGETRIAGGIGGGYKKRPLLVYEQAPSSVKNN